MWQYMRLESMIHTGRMVREIGQPIFAFLGTTPVLSNW